MDKATLVFSKLVAGTDVVEKNAAMPTTREGWMKYYENYGRQHHKLSSLNTNETAKVPIKSVIKAAPAYAVKKAQEDKNYLGYIDGKATGAQALQSAMMLDKGRKFKNYRHVRENGKLKIYGLN